ncbi:hypothetical protein ACHAWF_009426 [Thalassiosira exigua]
MLSLVAEACPGIRVLFIHTQGETSDRDLEYGRQVLNHLCLSENLTVAKSDVSRDEFRKSMAAVDNTLECKPDFYSSTFHVLSQNVFKLAPLKHTCAEYDVQCLLSGVRRGQTSHRDSLNFIQYPSASGDPDKAHPILDWSDEQCLEYLQFKNIPVHPEMNSVLREMTMMKQENVVSVVSNGHQKPEAKSQSNADQREGGLPNHRNSLFRSKRTEQSDGRECGLHVQGTASSGKDPVPPLPNMIMGKIKCRFCDGAKKLLEEFNVHYVEAPGHIFTHLVPSGAKTWPVIYLDSKLIGGYGDLCAHLGVKDTLNKN